MMPEVGSHNQGTDAIRSRVLNSSMDSMISLRPRTLCLGALAAGLLLVGGGCCCVNTSEYGGDWTPTPSPHIQNATDANFDKLVLEAEQPTLVDFWAPWCGPCKMVDPAIVTIAQERQDQINVARLNVDENPDIAGRYEVWSIPTLALFKDGEIVARHEGVPMDGDVTGATKQWLAEQLDQ